MDLQSKSQGAVHFPSLLDIVEARTEEAKTIAWWGPLTGSDLIPVNDNSKGGLQTVADDA